MQTEIDPLIPQFWEQATRLQGIQEAVVAIGAIVAEGFPLETLLLRELDRDAYTLRTLACYEADLDRSRSRSHTESAEESRGIEALEAWCAGGIVELIDPAESEYPFVHAVRPGDRQSPFLLGPLGITNDKTPSGRLGVAVFSARPGHRLCERDKRWLESLLGPLNVAVQNDSQLKTLTLQREAVESERRALLLELGNRRAKDTIVGAEGGLAGVIERVNLVARSDAPVLIFGETGTGKEVISRAIHVRSPRESKPFHRVNCGAIPPELIDSHLFGHEAGAFTGATETRKGWFERADGGTLFLDEIGDLPPAAQVRLLRILQDGHFERVGGQKPIQVDVRIVAATHRDLAQMVAESTFREDLWYRIAVFPVYLPPLRERLEDIPALADHFAEKAAVRFGLPLVHPSQSDIRALQSYHWPGNVRELGTVIDRAAILGNGRSLEISAALGINLENVRPSAERAKESSARSTARIEAGSDSFSIAPLDVVIRQHIERVLAAVHGRIEGPGGAAELLQINPHTLRSRMRKMQIDWHRFRGEKDR